MISMQVDTEKWKNVELLTECRIRLGKEKPLKEDIYDFNNGFASRFPELKYSI